MSVTRRSLTEQEGDAIWRDRQAGMSWEDLRNRYGRSQSTIARALKQHKPSKKGSLVLMQQALERANSLTPTDIVRQAVTEMVSKIRGLPVRLMAINFRDQEVVVEFAQIETFKLGD